MARNPAYNSERYGGLPVAATRDCCAHCLHLVDYHDTRSGCLTCGCNAVTFIPEWVDENK